MATKHLDRKSLHRRGDAEPEQFMTRACRASTASARHERERDARRLIALGNGADAPPTFDAADDPSVGSGWLSQDTRGDEPDRLRSVEAQRLPRCREPPLACRLNRRRATRQKRCGSKKIDARL
jgi:hypothetical protein